MQVIVSQFPGKDYALDALKRIKKLDLKSGSAAVLSKDAGGKVRVKETDDWGAGRGAAAGAVAGAVLPIVGWVSGAIAGAVAAKLHDGGFPDDKLKAMAHSLEADSSMFLMLTNNDLAPAVQEVLRDMGGLIEIDHELTEELSQTLSEALEEELGHIVQDKSPAA
jgi:uncharacterized membrane protein